ncbi:hypothetical protein Pst134EA_031956 [Puccinia striiformis f. sp. tritici]|uniref:uncharacterized protein n=1 Tax=Puccinia striiformis f. sp. tritici TaxID=168172 RepID=UPI0020083C52|nr:uncharacterized protein Pst134EA_031956 [Puccinia striiformis f. sp. tritici]KAH9444414.1 hypothetical protein Pst134EA_031956 [Puccinia striiformis f. sp. tritici]
MITCVMVKLAVDDIRDPMLSNPINRIACQAQQIDFCKPSTDAALDHIPSIPPPSSSSTQNAYNEDQSQITSDESNGSGESLAITPGLSTRAAYYGSPDLNEQGILGYEARFFRTPGDENSELSSRSSDAISDTRATYEGSVLPSYTQHGDPFPFNLIDGTPHRMPDGSTVIHFAQHPQPEERSVFTPQSSRSPSPDNPLLTHAPFEMEEDWKYGGTGILESFESLAADQGRSHE